MFHVSGEPGCFLSDFCNKRNIFCPANSDPPAVLENIRSREVRQILSIRKGVNPGGNMKTPMTRRLL